MADADFILEILARLRDEASPGLAKLKKEINSLKGTQDAEIAEKDLGDAIKDTGDEAERSKKKHEGHRSELEKSRRAADDAGRGARSLSEDLDRGRSSADANADSMGRAAKETRQFHSDVETGKRARQDLGSDIDDLNKKMESLTVRRDELNKRTLLPNDVKAANELRESWADLDRQMKSVASSYSRLATSRKEGEEALRSDALKKSEAGFLEAAQARAEAERLLKLVPASRQPTSVDTAAQVARIKASEKEAEAQRELALNYSKTENAWKNFQQTLNRGNLSKSESQRGLKEFSNQFTTLRRNLVAGGQDLGNTDRYLDDIAKKLKKTDFGASGGFLNSLKTRNIDAVFESLDSKIGDLGIRITGVASFFTGLFEIIKIGFSQQLITGVLSLAGGLFSLASAATQAGAALAGAFVSGLGQAIPMLSIVAAAAERFKTILQAVSVAGQAEQQKFFNPGEKQILQLQQASQLTSANQQLANSNIQVFDAQQRVRDSQIALTEARYTALRQITELSLAEKNARLQAEGATISLTESKRQLQIAIQRGDVAGLQQAELGVKEAELNKRKADFEIPKTEREARLARERGVGGAPSVISAVRGLESSRLSVVQAQQGAEAAQRQKQILDLQRQARSSKETQYESQLKFLEKGMSPTELGLTNALIGLEKELKSPSSPLKKITDYIVEPFAKAVSRVRSLLGNSSLLAPIKDLAKSMGSGLNRLEEATFGVRGTSFFETMAKDASSNVPVITSSIEHIMHLFEDIAKAAAPAFHKLSEDWDKFWGKLDTKYEGKGLEKLEKFFNKSVEYAEDFGKLGAAVFNLFKALGSDAAPQGLLTVTSFTGAIKDATTWVDGHKSSVTNFFKEAREGLGLIGSTLFQIGKQLIEVFNLDSLRAFSAFINQVILPGLRLMINIMGKLTTIFLDFFNILGKPGRDFLAVIGAIIVTIVGITKIYEPVKTAITLIKGLGAAMEALKAKEGLSAAWTALAAAFDKTGKSAAAAKAEVIGLRDAEAGAVAAAEADTAAQTGVAGAEGAAGAGGLGGLFAGGAAGIAGRFIPPVLGALAVGESFKKGMGSTGESKGLLSDTTGFITGGLVGNASTSPVGLVKQLLGGDASQERLRSFMDKVEKLKGSLNDLPKNKLQEITSEARTLANDPSLEKYKGNLESVTAYFSPMEKANRRWAQTLQNNMEGLLPSIKDIATTFESISASSGRIWKNIKDVTKENIESIRENLGLSSKQGKEALAANFGDAELKIEESMKKGGMSTQIGMARIKKLVSEALSKYGVKPSEINSSLSNTGHTTVLRTNKAGGIFEEPRHASGAYVPATPGGQRAVIGEGGHDEVVLSTDPKHAQRSRSLLGQYFSRAPHMAEGGFIADPGTNFTVNQEPKIVTELQKLGEYLHTTIYGISGYRSPAHSVEVGGFSNDPHTRGEAADIGVGSNTLASAARLTAGLLAKFDLYRPFYPASAHEINHVQLLPGSVAGIKGSSAGAIGSIAQSARAFKELIAPKIKGGGAIGQISQGALNLATKAANIYLSKQIGSSAGSAAGMNFAGVSGSGGTPSANEMLGKQMMIAAGWPASMWPSLQALWTQESGWNANSVNPSSGAYGIPQSLGHGHPYNLGDARAQIAWGLNYIKGRYGSPDAAEAHERAYNWYDKGGVIQALRSFAAGGRAPWGGRPVPIIAHEGERIMNPAQYSATARLAGTSPRGLDNYLGYDGSPRQSFAAGGSPTAIKSWDQVITPNELPSLSSEFNIGTIGSIVKIFKKIKEGFKKLKDISKKDYEKELIKFINEITIETSGILARLQEGREYFKVSLERKAIGKEYNKSGNKIKLAPKGEVGIAEFSEKNLAQESKYLQDEKNIIEKTIRETKKLKKSSARTTALKTLALKQKELNEVIDQNIEARYQAETQVIQARITEANNQYQVSSQELSTKISKAQALGNLGNKTGEVGQLEEQSASSAQSQIAKLTPILQQAEKIGNKELESSIKQEIISLQQTINSAIVEKISNAQTLLQRESQSAEAKSGEKLGISKVLAAEGKYEAASREEKAGLTEKQANLLATKAQEEVLKEEALREGDIAAAITLGEELNNNSVEIAENNLALKENAVITRELMISQIEATGQFKSGIYSAAQQGLETLGKITGSTNVAGLIAAAKGREGVYGEERTGLEKEAGGIGLGVEGMSPAQLLTYLSSPEGMAKIKQLESHEDKAEQEQMYKLITALETNATNTLKNAEELAKLNGQLNQPQSWSTAAFNSFRTSFFSGMGGLLEPYSAALPPGSRPEGLPNYGTGSPGQAATRTHIENVNLTHPVEVLDPSLLGEELSYHIATTPPTS